MSDTRRSSRLLLGVGLGLVVGFLLGVLLCVSTFEVMHKVIEVRGAPFCSLIYDELSGTSRNITYGLKVVYKAFAWPTKTLWIYLNQDGEIVDKRIEP